MDSDCSIDDPRFLSDATHGEIKGMVIDRDPPDSTFAKHPNRRDTYGASVPFLYRGIPAFHPPEHQPEDSEDHQWHPAKILESLPGLLRCLHLGLPDLVKDLAKGLLIGGSDDVDNRLLLPRHVTLDRCCHIHLIKHREVLAAFVAGLHGLVFINCFCQTGNRL